MKKTINVNNKANVEHIASSYKSGLNRDELNKMIENLRVLTSSHPNQYNMRLLQELEKNEKGYKLTLSA